MIGLFDFVRLSANREPTIVHLLTSSHKCGPTTIYPEKLFILFHFEINCKKVQYNKPPPTNADHSDVPCKLGFRCFIENMYIGFVYHAKLCMKLRSVQYLRVEHLCVHSELPVAYGVCLRRELMYSL